MSWMQIRRSEELWNALIKIPHCSWDIVCCWCLGEVCCCCGHGRAIAVLLISILTKVVQIHLSTLMLLLTIFCYVLYDYISLSLSLNELSIIWAQIFQLLTRWQGSFCSLSVLVCMRVLGVGVGIQIIHLSGITIAGLWIRDPSN